MTPAEARAEFAAAGTYLNTATYGLPPRATREAVTAVLGEWAAGTAHPPDYDVALYAARDAYAALVCVTPDLVAVGSQVSVLVGTVAATVPGGAEVLVAEGEFTSVTFPFLARGAAVREVPLRELAGAVTGRTALVAVSAVQSSSGEVLDLDALERTCAAHGTRVLLDTTQAVGWLPVDASRFAYTVCGGYKWLLAARGTAFLTVQPDLLQGLVPLSAGWYAGEHPWTSIYGSPLRLAADARRLDVSPAWHSWVGAAPSLALLNAVGVPALHVHSAGLAARFCEAVGVAPTGSAIVSLEADDDVPALLRDARITSATRAGRLRLSFHLCVGADEVDAAAGALRGHVR